MTYSEVQAIVQLSVGLNVGIFALKELSIPYLTRQRNDFASLRAYLGEAKELIVQIPTIETREEKLQHWNILFRKVMRIWPQSTSIRRGLDHFIFFMSVAAGIAAVLGLWMLYDTSQYYSQQIPNHFLPTVSLCYAPLLIGAAINIYARFMGYRLMREQKSIQQELSKLI